MANFRSGLKIFGELSLRQNLGRLRSFSEDRKPEWSPEDQWAVRPPCTTCPDPCAPPQKPKSTKSWLSICKDPEPPIPCDIRHNNCPAPQKTEEPWYAFITKKKPEKPKPPLNACRLELQRQAEEEPVEDFCEDLEDNRWPDVCAPEVPEPECTEKPPAPVIRLSCPPPKDLDLMLWCGRPGVSVSRIAAQCQSDRMPFEEFKPRKIWKPPPFSLPCKNEAPAHQPFCSNVGRAPLAEFKQVDIPKPLYTRYKSVELEDENFLLCMTDAKCPDDDSTSSVALQPAPIQKYEPPVKEPKSPPCPEKPVLVAASQKPVKLRCAPKFQFRPKPTKLIERRVYWNPCGQYNTFNLQNIDPPSEQTSDTMSPVCDSEAPKVITSTLTDEPQTFQPNTPSRKPPQWMYMLSKPGSKDTPLVPHVDLYPGEPDWCSETDGLNFYDGQDEGINPKPPPDPCKRVANAHTPEPPPPCPHEPPPPPPPPPEDIECVEPTEKFVLMPEKYNIRNMRPPEEPSEEKDLQEASFHEFIEAKTSNVRKCSKLYPQIKENILYDLARNCPLPPVDPTKPDPEPRRPPPPECPQPTRFYSRRYSTLSAVHLRKPNYAKVLNRMNSEDSGDKCKVRKLIPKPKPCNDRSKDPTCNETEMPCCPKARIPPRCDVKAPLPPCKKKLPPKPSYSECARDPPPCPRITECNAWEKRDLENSKKNATKSRRFSHWAPDQELVVADALKTESTNWDGFPAPGPSYSDNLDKKDRGKSLNKNKWSSRNVFSGKELMLNFVNPTEEPNSYYTSDSLVRRRKPQWRKLNSVRPKTKKSDQSVGSQLHQRKVITALLQDHHTRNDVRIKNLGIREKDSALSVFTTEETSSKAIIGSIGTFINGLIKAQRNRPHSCPPQLSQPQSTTYVETVDVDRIMKLTQPFSHKLESQSTENVNYLTTDATVENVEYRKQQSPFRRFWPRSRSLSLTALPKFKRDRARSSMWKFETLSPILDFSKKSNIMKSAERNQKNFRHQNDGSKFGNSESRTRFDIRKLDEYSMPKMENFAGRTLLLNVSGNFYDDQRLGIPYCPRMNGFRCYTATASMKKNLSRDNFKETRRTISKFSVASRAASSISRIHKMKVSALERNETHTSTNLVQNLIKKVKAGRFPSNKIKDNMDGTKQGKAKFQQSATMVASTLAKKDFESGKRGTNESKLLTFTSTEKAITPLNIPNKPWIYIDRGYDSNLKYDFKKAIAHATVIKAKPQKWFQDTEELSRDTRDYLYDSKKGKKRSGETLLKADLKYSSDKSLKRQEVKNVLSKLELSKTSRTVVDKSLKMNRKEPHRKDLFNMFEHYSCAENPEKTSGRYSWQHEIFRNNAKSGQNKNVMLLKGEESYVNEVKSLIVPKSAKLSLSEPSKELNNNVELYDPTTDVVQCVSLEEKSTQSNSNRSAKQVGVISKMKRSKIQNDYKLRDKLIGSSIIPDKELVLPLEGTEVRPMTTGITIHDHSQPSSLQASFHSQKFESDKGSCSNKCKSEKRLDKSEKEVKRTKKEKACESPQKTSSKCAKDETSNHDANDEISDIFGCRVDKIKKPGPNCPEN